MITFERKKINNKLFYYLSDQIKVNKKFKKIQVFVGKNIPKDCAKFYTALKQKEEDLIEKQLKYKSGKEIPLEPYTIKTIESARIDWKYYVAQLTPAKLEKLLRNFAIQFIFESNAIEGSKLSEQEVMAIVKKQYIRKSLPEKEIQEVLNSIEAFAYLQSDDFSLNQKQLKKLHAIVTTGLAVPAGFKKKDIVVNNKETVPPKEVRNELTKLFLWYKKTKPSEHPFARAVIFHNRFEHIHPFTDGNGRVGRLLFNWMLMNDKYGLILFKNSNRTAYMSALDKGDEGIYRNIIKLSTKIYKKTIQDLIK